MRNIGWQPTTNRTNDFVVLGEFLALSRSGHDAAFIAGDRLKDILMLYSCGTWHVIVVSSYVV